MTTFPFVFTEQAVHPPRNMPKIRLFLLSALLCVSALSVCVVAASQHDMTDAERFGALNACLTASLVVFSFVAYRLMPYRAFVVALSLMLGFGGSGLYLLDSFS